MFDFANPSIAAAWIGVLGMALGGLIGWFSSHSLRRENLLSSNLREQLRGWMNFTNELQDRVKALEGRIADCERDRADLWRRIGSIDRSC